MPIQRFLFDFDEGDNKHGQFFKPEPNKCCWSSFLHLDVWRMAQACMLAARAS